MNRRQTARGTVSVPQLHHSLAVALCLLFVGCSVRNWQATEDLLERYGKVADVPVATTDHWLSIARRDLPWIGKDYSVRKSYVWGHPTTDPNVVLKQGYLHLAKDRGKRGLSLVLGYSGDRGMFCVLHWNRSFKGVYHEQSEVSESDIEMALRLVGRKGILPRSEVPAGLVRVEDAEKVFANEVHRTTRAPVELTDERVTHILTTNDERTCEYSSAVLFQKQSDQGRFIFLETIPLRAGSTSPWRPVPAQGSDTETKQETDEAEQ